MNRKLIVMLIMAATMMFAVSGVAYAGWSEYPPVEDGDLLWTWDGDPDSWMMDKELDLDYLLQGVDTDTWRPERKNPAGVGIDLMLWQNANKNAGFESQYKYDMRNKEHSIYGVVKVNLWDMLKKK